MFVNFDPDDPNGGYYEDYYGRRVRGVRLIPEDEQQQHLLEMFRSSRSVRPSDDGLGVVIPSQVSRVVNKAQFRNLTDPAGGRGHIATVPLFHGTHVGGLRLINAAHPDANAYASGSSPFNKGRWSTTNYATNNPALAANYALDLASQHGGPGYVYRVRTTVGVNHDPGQFEEGQIRNPFTLVNEMREGQTLAVSHDGILHVVGVMTPDAAFRLAEQMGLSRHV